MTRAFALMAIAAVLPLLGGCFPLAVTGVATGALMIEDRRTTGTFVEDEVIENKALLRINEKYPNGVHVNVTSFNRVALITGEVPDANARRDIEAIVAGVQNVRSVQNELSVAPVASLSSRSRDTYITSKVKARFVDAAQFQANHVKVVTEGGVVYLLGLVRKSEADAAAEIAAKTQDVRKVVRVVEFIE